jgi:hypothetical protein
MVKIWPNWLPCMNCGLREFYSIDPSRLNQSDASHCHLTDTISMQNEKSLSGPSPFREAASDALLPTD